MNATNGVMAPGTAAGLITRLKNGLMYRLAGTIFSGSKEVDAGVGTRNEASRLVWLERALRRIPAGSRILDAGAGEQRFKALCSQLEYVSQDFGKYDGTGNRKGLQTGSWDQTRLDLVCDIVAIPEPDSSFDAIMCVEVFEHIPEPILAIREFSRLLKPGGQLIITAPFCSLTHLAPYHFYTGFNRYFYETHLPAHGFVIAELQPNGNFFEYLAQEIRRIPSMAEQYAADAPNSRESLALDSAINLLARLSHSDHGSADMLHFGFHVRALKR